MKKKGLLLMGLACMLAFSGCKKTDDAKNEGEDILKQIETANADDTLMKKYDKVAYRTDFIYGEDDIYSEYSYRDHDLYVVEGDDFMYVDDNGDVYGFDNGETVAFRYLFVGDSYEEFREDECVAGYYYEGDVEKVVNQEEKDGMLIVDVENNDPARISEYAESFSYDEDLIECVACTYEIDADSYELYTTTASIVMKDGEKKIVIVSERIENPDTYVVDEQLKSVVFEGDRRKVTIVENPGTAQEVTYAQTISKGNDIMIYIPFDAEQTFYEDEDCSKEFTGVTSNDEDVTMYYLR